MEIVICDNADKCDSRTCSYRKPFAGSTVSNVLCSYVKKLISLHVWEDMAKNNPNYLFRSNRNGL